MIGAAGKRSASSGAAARISMWWAATSSGACRRAEGARWRRSAAAKV
ncbi:unnamed protein product [[Actinomadura] parvosata subsp. kistnae]|nr:unnamed protein product [Actinomadura parvosata subsp. kistnae]